MAQLPATRHLKAPQPNQAKCPRVSDSAVLLFAKSGSLSQVLSSQWRPARSRSGAARGTETTDFARCSSGRNDVPGATDRRG